MIKRLEKLVEKVCWAVAALLVRMLFIHPVCVSPDKQQARRRMEC